MEITQRSARVGGRNADSIGHGDNWRDSNGSTGLATMALHVSNGNISNVKLRNYSTARARDFKYRIWRTHAISWKKKMIKNFIVTMHCN